MAATKVWCFCPEVRDMSALQSSRSPSSWLDIKWFSRHDDSTTQPSSDNPSDSYASLCEELNALKHQFVPASAACAESINNFHHQNGSKEKTNASFEFRRARSVCNLYESLGRPTGQSKPRKFCKKRGRSSLSNSCSHSGLAQFVNRSAIKLANIDALLRFSLTNPHRQQITAKPGEQQADQQVAHSATQAEQHRYFAFADLCGAPGGFSEYIMYRCTHPVKLIDEKIQTRNSNSSNNDSKQGNEYKDYYNNSICGGRDVTKINIPCHGFGMSLIGSNEDGAGVSWDCNHLQIYHLSSAEDSRPSATRTNSEIDYSHVFYQVCNGSDGTGDIYNWDNVLCLRRQMIETLSRISLEENDRGSNREDQIAIDDALGLVHLVVADGGFDAQRDSTSQEQLALRVIVCQTAAALTLLKPGGNFVLKMFGFQLERTKRVLQHLYDNFEKMTFVKPILSRPASAERYLVCCGYGGQSKGWNGRLWRKEMMEETQCSHETEKSVAQKNCNYSDLNTLMNVFDIQMLQLNIDACQSILDHLNKRNIAAQRGDASAVYQQKEDTDLQIYKKLWQLW
ncbi:hypothetical protein HJC23_012746 [Cyclotella cryptica]|uniref:Cap-specific mRNA (nucleoside-2'-O-)-methyltransferase 1 n=1 Tax=Cyclotella cryptica TaxID=29204 RepID=A0ABD3P454_9STRA